MALITSGSGVCQVAGGSRRRSDGMAEVDEKLYDRLYKVSPPALPTRAERRRMRNHPEAFSLLARNHR